MPSILESIQGLVPILPIIPHSAEVKTPPAIAVFSPKALRRVLPMNLFMQPTEFSLLEGDLLVMVRRCGFRFVPKFEFQGRSGSLLDLKLTQKEHQHFNATR